VRGESTATGEDRSGHIAAQANEGILFFDSECWNYRYGFNISDKHRLISS
jgi:hypothetical protein